MVLPESPKNEAERKWPCACESHGHKVGKCKGTAIEPDGLWEPCHDRTAEQLARIIKRDRPLARLRIRFMAIITALAAAAYHSTPAPALTREDCDADPKADMATAKSGRLLSMSSVV
jgi:hypothetical protein